MKKLLIICALYCLAICNPIIATANNAAAGEIYYEWMSDSTYRFYFKLVIDCSGSAEPTTVPLCLHDPCDNSKSFSVSMAKFGSATDVPIGCTKIKNRCDSVASTLNGYKEWLYSAVVTLPARCDAWHMFTYVNYRNSSNNLASSTSKPLYVEVRFNNTGSFQGNSSPAFSSKLVVYAFQNIPNVYNYGALDPDGDSLDTEVIAPLSNVATCADTVASAIGFLSFTPAISIPGNPFPSNNTFSVSNGMEQSIFSPSVLGRHTVAFRIKEYRNGTLIGYTVRELQVQVMAGSFKAPLITLITAPGAGTGMQQGCANMQMNFSFKVNGDPNSMFSVTDNLFTAIPGASITYANQNSDLVTGLFSWTPTVADTGRKSIIITAKDTTCKPPGIVFHYPFVIALYIWGNNTYAMNDTTICMGDAIDLNASGSAQYTWSVLPPGNSSSLSCTGCSNPKANPSSYTSYVVEGTTLPGCPVSKDTVALYVNSNLTYPTMSIEATPDTFVAPGTSVTFSAKKTNCGHPVYVWRINGIVDASATQDIYTSSSFNDMDIVTCEMICNDSCPKPSAVNSNAITIHNSFPSAINTQTTSSKVSIYPNPNNGSFTINAKLPGKTTCDILVLNTVGQSVYSRAVALDNSMLNKTIKLDVPDGVYALRIDGKNYRVVIRNK